MESPQWNHKPMHCMVCSSTIPVHRRAGNSWFCSQAHQRVGMAAGLMGRVQTQRAQKDWDHDRNPIDPMSCYFCGYPIGLLRRTQGHEYCTEECYLAHHVHQRSEPTTGRRDALVAAGVMGIAGAMLMLDRQMAGGRPAPVATTPNRPLVDLSRWLPKSSDVPLSFKTEEGLKLWAATQDAWRVAENAAQPLKSILYNGIKEFRSGAVELTTRGGAGLLVSASENLASYHFISFRPIYGGGRIVDYSLDYGTRTDSETLQSSSRRLRLGSAVAGQRDATFRVEKKGHNLEAFLEIAPGNRRWLHKWEERTLPDGRLGLYVGEGQRYAVIAGRIQADDFA
jgi:hypothetical protein